MKRLFCIVLVILTLVSLSACAPQPETTLSVTPATAQTKMICELATMKCYYHNVAKYFEADAEGWGPWKKDRHFWIEYSGIVTLGIDVNKVDIVVDGTDVTITLPPAEVQTCTVDRKSLTGDYIIIDRNSAEVRAEHQTKACSEAEENMKKAASGNTALLASAQQRAQRLLENYVNNIGNLTKQNYNIKWIYIDAEGNIIKTVNSESATSSTQAVSSAAE